MSVINLANLLYDIVRQAKLDSNLKQLLQNKVQNLISSLPLHNIINTGQDFTLELKLLECTSAEQKAEILMNFCELINQDILAYLYTDNNFLAQKINFLDSKINETNIEIELLKKQLSDKAFLIDNVADISEESLKALQLSVSIEEKHKSVKELNKQIKLLREVISLRDKTNSSEFTQSIKSINEQLDIENNLFFLDHETLSQTFATAEVFEEKTVVERKLNQTAFRSNQQKIGSVENCPENLAKRINSPHYAYAVGLYALYANEKEQIRLQQQPQKLAVLKAKYVDLRNATQAMLEPHLADNVSRISHLRAALVLNDQQYQILATHTSWLKKILHFMAVLFGFNNKNFAKSSFTHPVRPSFFATQTTNKFQHLLSQVEQLEEVSQIVKNTMFAA